MKALQKWECLEGIGFFLVGLNTKTRLSAGHVPPNDRFGVKSGGFLLSGNLNERGRTRYFA
jgi:hypothetical protein